jgi:sugar/nucleoside kinase (ribokinase family)
LQHIFRLAKESGATTSLDMTLPDPDSISGQVSWQKILDNVLPYVDLFLPSVEESYYMLAPDKFLSMKRKHQNADLLNFFSPEDYSWISAQLLAKGSKVVALKSGARGFYLRTGKKESFTTVGKARPADVENWSNRELWAPAFKPVRLMSAAGSGDSSIAGFLAAYLKSLTIEEAMKYATCCGWQNLRELDAVSGIESWDETTEYVNKKMPLLDSKIESKKWKWCENFGLWAGPNDMVLA